MLRYLLTYLLTNFDWLKNTWQFVWTFNPGYLIKAITRNISTSTTVWATPLPSVNGWILILNRFDPSLDFNQSWSEYVDGFGSSDSNYWMGLEKIYQLTRTGQWRMTLVVELASVVDYYDNPLQITNNYATFYLDSEADSYALHVGNYSGDDEDVLNLGIPPGGPDYEYYHQNQIEPEYNYTIDSLYYTPCSPNGSPFNTYDHITADHGLNCQDLSVLGGWWFCTDNHTQYYCYTCALNGQYSPDNSGFGHYLRFASTEFETMASARMTMQMV